MTKNRYYAGIAIDIIKSKSLIFNRGYGPYSILKFLADQLNEKYGLELSNSKLVNEANYSGKLFSIKEGDMLMGIIPEYYYDLSRKIYHELNSIYYSGKFQYELSKWLSKENKITLEFNTAITFNGMIQQSDTNINEISWDIINGTVISSTKYLLNSYHKSILDDKKIETRFNVVNNLPFKIKTCVLKRTPSQDAIMEEQGIVVDDYYSNLLQLLFYSSYSSPFTEKNILNIRKIIFFTLFDEKNNRVNNYKNLFLMAANLDTIYHMKSYKDATQNMGLYFNDSDIDGVTFYRRYTNYNYFKEKNVYYTRTDDNNILGHRKNYSTRISNIISDMHIESLQNNIAVLDNTIKRIKMI